MQRDETEEIASGGDREKLGKFQRASVEIQNEGEPLESLRQIVVVIADLDIKASIAGGCLVSRFCR